VARGDVDAIGIGGSADRGDDIDHLHRHILRPRPLLHRRLIRDRHPSAAGRRDARKLIENPAPRRTDAACLGGCVRQCMARTEGDEFVDRLLHPRRIELRDYVVDAGALGVKRSREDGEEQGGGKGSHRHILL